MLKHQASRYHRNSRVQRRPAQEVEAGGDIDVANDPNDPVAKLIMANRKRTTAEAAVVKQADLSRDGVGPPSVPDQRRKLQSANSQAAGHTAGTASRYQPPRTDNKTPRMIRASPDAKTPRMVESKPETPRMGQHNGAQRRGGANTQMGGFFNA